MPNQEETKALRTEVLNVLDKWQPSTVGNLMALLIEKRGISAREESISAVLKELRTEGKLELERPPTEQNGFLAFLRNPATAKDFWSLIGSVVFLDAIVAFRIGDWFDSFRFGLGTLIVLFFPGYSMQMSLFPRKEDMILWKRILLAVALSIAAAGFYATILDATSQGISLGSVLFIFSIHTLIFSGIGLVRRYEAQRRFTIEGNLPR